jgi:hypothetical protein
LGTEDGAALSLACPSQTIALTVVAFKLIGDGDGIGNWCSLGVWATVVAPVILT